MRRLGDVVRALLHRERTPTEVSAEAHPELDEALKRLDDELARFHAAMRPLNGHDPNAQRHGH